MKINLKKGDILKDNNPIVIPVNTIGVIRRGLARRTVDLYPDVYRSYIAALDSGELRIGRVAEVRVGRRIFLLFPTKKDWKDRSKVEYITSGLKSLKNLVEKRRYKTISIPALGCELGGLKWDVVGKLIYKEVQNWKIGEINLYPPQDKFNNKWYKKEFYDQ